MCLSSRFYFIKAFFINVISLLTHLNTSLRAQPLEAGVSQAQQKKVFSHDILAAREAKDYLLPGEAPEEDNPSDSAS